MNIDLNRLVNIFEKDMFKVYGKSLSKNKKI